MLPVSCSDLRANEDRWRSERQAAGGRDDQMKVGEEIRDQVPGFSVAS